MDKAFVEDEDSSFQKTEPHRKFNTQWRTIYSRVYKGRNTGDVPLRRNSHTCTKKR